MRIIIDIPEDELRKIQTPYPTSYPYPYSTIIENDPCAGCPNNPSNPNSRNYGGVCGCTLPSMYGPNRVTY